ncbi:helix-turn-helix domain-containing protein [Brucepastera parasyntrophica]|uniref:helix-turn-helix domain-containing protein n=1 Tax=Brucepastera parasyntrophica TaxID=2880008 RepID=UPI00210D65B4|nr:helix-turn-helix transcriptional regulator [Brucepastera parasyntrophica]ULQ60278.1 helix-turn-helix domain-containing protein [Brucepastera parasyntrophica]
MALSDRIRTIIQETGLSQKDFAQSLNVTGSYISKLLRNESGVSNTTAMLIEKLYGYSSEWIMDGKGACKRFPADSEKRTSLQKKIISNVEQMEPLELEFLYSFITSLKTYIEKKGDI